MHAVIFVFYTRTLSSSCVQEILSISSNSCPSLSPASASVLPSASFPSSAKTLRGKRVTRWNPPIGNDVSTVRAKRNRSRRVAAATSNRRRPLRPALPRTMTVQTSVFFSGGGSASRDSGATGGGGPASGVGSASVMAASGSAADGGRPFPPSFSVVASFAADGGRPLPPSFSVVASCDGVRKSTVRSVSTQPTAPKSWGSTSATSSSNRTPRCQHPRESPTLSVDRFPKSDRSRAALTSGRRSKPRRRESGVGDRTHFFPRGRRTSFTVTSSAGTSKRPQARCPGVPSSSSSSSIAMGSASPAAGSTVLVRRAFGWCSRARATARGRPTRPSSIVNSTTPACVRPRNCAAISRRYGRANSSSSSSPSSSPPSPRRRRKRPSSPSPTWRPWRRPRRPPPRRRPRTRPRSTPPGRTARIKRRPPRRRRRTPRRRRPRTRPR
mmetsp:Transcript_40116/g.94259  ORF Transcript_40116/g.94259 Transcript_40116/m.94259 type:complete len:440 (-) Transcript_40116:14-1333(-)